MSSSSRSSIQIGSLDSAAIQKAPGMLLRTLLPATILFILGAAPPTPVSQAKPIPLPGIVARSIGPAAMGGRITSLSIDDKNPSLQYAAAASGGIWKTTDNGKNWKCVFD